MTSAATALPQPAPRPPARASQWFYRGLRKLARLTGGGWDVRGHVIIAVPLDRLRVPQRRGRGGLQVRWLTPEDCPALDQLRPASGKPYAHRFAEAHRAVGAFLSPAPGQAPRLLAFCWVLRGPARLPTSFGCAWDLPASVAWLYDLYSDPSVLGAVSHLYLYIQEHPPGPGLLYLAGQNDFENSRSRMAHLSLGFERLATVWSLKAGPWWHCSHGGNGWRAYGPEAAIPVAWLTPAPGARVALAPPVGFGNELWLQCGCGERVGLGDQPLVCRACGRKLGAWRQGFADVGPPLPYWGEIPQPDMEALLRRGEQAGWRRAVEELLTPELCEYVAAPARAAFQELLPLATGARILDLGAGWGSIAAPLARRYEVVALEGVAERARFIALRKQQEGLEHLTVVRGRIQEARFGPAQFDVVIANGVLEWSALDDLRDEPRRVQVRCLERMRELL
ncbi:MAG: class I SAM-dependent methyltransferase, partial [Terriglobales bacterium]